MAETFKIKNKTGRKKAITEEDQQALIELVKEEIKLHKKNRNSKKIKI